jgi:hypothetical protein
VLVSLKMAEASKAQRLAISWGVKGLPSHQPMAEPLHELALAVFAAAALIPLLLHLAMPSPHIPPSQFLLPPLRRPIS